MLLRVMQEVLLQIIYQKSILLVQAQTLKLISLITKVLVLMVKVYLFLQLQEEEIMQYN